MPDFTPPPRRPAPAKLRDEISRALDAAPARPFRWRTVVVPVAAASLIGATVLGITTISDRATVVPAQTASPYSATVTPTPAPVTPTAEASTPAVSRLGIRPMSKAEIKADTRSCRKPSDPGDDLPRPKGVRTEYAQVELRAGVGGPLPDAVRVLMLTDSAGSWVCENGQNTSWSSGDLVNERPTSAVPVMEVENFGGTSSTCSEHPRVHGDELFAVGDAVALGRVRVIVGSDRGPWQTVEPTDGVVHFLYGLEGPDTGSRAVSTEYQFLDQRGRVLATQPYGARRTPTTKTSKSEVMTCANVRDMEIKPKPIPRPASDKAGVASCLAMVKEHANESEVPFHSDRWRSRLTVSTSSEWGAVLSDGDHRVGCSLFPTREISRLVPDNDTVDPAAFRFALNPIPVPDGESLWAAGRVPRDVTAISYRLPGDHDVAAKISADGYWMVKHHEPDGKIATGNVDKWAPVVVTVTRPSGTQTFVLQFTEKNMCNQVSHGC